MEEWLSLPGGVSRRVPGLPGAGPIVQQELAEALEPVELHPGETLFGPGDPRDAMYFILAGLVSLTARRLKMATAARPAVLGAGEAVGEIGLVADGPHTSTARALDDTLRLAADQDRLRGAAREVPGGRGRAVAGHRARGTQDPAGPGALRLGSASWTRPAGDPAGRNGVPGADGRGCPGPPGRGRGPHVRRGLRPAAHRHAAMPTESRRSSARSAGATPSVKASLLTGEVPLGHGLRPARQRGRGHHTSPLRDAAVPVSGRGGAPEPHRLAPGAARAGTQPGRGRRGPPARCRQRCRAAGRRAAGGSGGAHRGVRRLCRAAGVGAVDASATTLHLSSARLEELLGVAGHCPGRPRTSGAGAGCLAAAAGAKLRLRDLRGGRRAGRPGRNAACGWPTGCCWWARATAAPVSHRIGRAARAPQRFHHGPNWCCSSPTASPGPRARRPGWTATRRPATITCAWAGAARF